jgi:hypothetical protein
MKGLFGRAADIAVSPDESLEARDLILEQQGSA